MTLELLTLDHRKENIVKSAQTHSQEKDWIDKTDCNGFAQALSKPGRSLTAPNYVAMMIMRGGAVW